MSKLKQTDVRDIIIISLIMITLIPFLTGSLVSLIYGQNETEILSLWWLGFSKPGLILSIIAEVVFLVVAIIVLYIRADYHKVDDKNRVMSDVPIYGDAHFMTEKEIKAKYVVSKQENANRVILGAIDKECKKVVSERKYTSSEKPDNENFFVCGAAGVGKSTCFTVPLILQVAKAGENMLITDPKGELYRLTAKYLERMGYSVHTFITKEIWMKYSDRYNPMDFLEQNVIKANVLATSLLELQEEDGKKPDYFNNGEYALLVAVSLYLTNNKLAHEEKCNTIPYMYKFLATTAPADIAAALSSLPPGAPGYEAAQVFISNSQRWADFVSGLQVQLQKYVGDDVVRMMETSDFEPLDFVFNKSVVFLITDDHDSTFTPLARCFFNQFVNKISEIADSLPADPERGYEAQKIYPAFNMILEETNNIGRLSALENMLSTVRGRNMNTMLSFQNVEQMKATYKDKRESLISACHTQVFYGVNDIATAEYVSKWLGSTTVRTDTQSRTEGTVTMVDVVLQQQHRYQDVEAPLLTADQAMRKSGKVLIRTVGQAPMELFPLYYKLHKDYPLLYEENVNKRLPTRYRDEKYNAHFGIPSHDREKEKRIKNRVRELLQVKDVVEQHEHLLDEKLTDQPGLDIKQPDPKINQNSLPLKTGANFSKKPPKRWDNEKVATPASGGKVIEEPVQEKAPAKVPEPEPKPAEAPKKQEEQPKEQKKTSVSKSKFGKSTFGGMDVPEFDKSEESDML